MRPSTIEKVRKKMGKEPRCSRWGEEAALIVPLCSMLPKFFPHSQESALARAVQQENRVFPMR